MVKYKRTETVGSTCTVEEYEFDYPNELLLFLHVESFIGKHCNEEESKFVGDYIIGEFNNVPK